ncbi:MAG: DUF1592 domain-containing protein [Polyangiaceae bacterium]
MRTGYLLPFLAGAALAAPACVGSIGDPIDTTDTTEAPICTGDKPMPGASPMRRLTKFEYNNAVRDLLGDTTEPAREFPAEEEALGFSNNAFALTVSPTLADKYMKVAEDVARRATNDVQGLTGCSEKSPMLLEGCVRSFIASFGRRAYRRPLAQEEVDQLFDVYLAAQKIYEPTPDVPSDESPYREGVAMVLEAILQSPDFLYRVELGEGLSADVASGAAVPLTSLEMASRLSFFIWGSVPDEDLLTAAESGQLTTKEQVEAQARRMLDSPKARDVVAQFHQQWLDYDRINNVTKDTELYPEWSPALGLLMQEEMRAFVEHVVFDEHGDLTTLLTADYSYADSNLARFYGVKNIPPDDGSFQRIDFPAGQHAGILSMGAILAYYAHTNQTSPVHRGKVVREMLFCDTLSPPPANISFELPQPDPNATTRERFAQHSQDPSCKGCHVLMDPIGFGFENFDTLGRFRSEENGKPIDSSGELTDTDVDGKFYGLDSLTTRMIESDDVKHCYAKMWFRWAYGRGETDADECNVSQLEQAFDDSGGNIKELLVALTQTDAFLYRVPGDTTVGGP